MSIANVIEKSQPYKRFLRSFHSVEMTNKMSSRATPRDLNRMDNRKRFLRYGLREGEMTIAGAIFVARLGTTKCNFHCTMIFPQTEMIFTVVNDIAKAMIFLLTHLIL